MIKVKDLSKNYGPVEAVKSISFDLKDGEVIGFWEQMAPVKQQP